MTSDLKVKLLSDLMDLREQLAQIQAKVSDLTLALASDDFPAEKSVLTHAAFIPNAVQHDEPKSHPLPPAA